MRFSSVAGTAHFVIVSANAKGAWGIGTRAARSDRQRPVFATPSARPRVGHREVTQAREPARSQRWRRGTLRVCAFPALGAD